ncbi:MAG: hypothetical protein O9350_16360, partial [Microcystis sp. LE19-388.1G]|nr:hypothetical protein [Microcystis sp. LE19-388.1G]
LSEGSLSISSSKVIIDFAPLRFLNRLQIFFQRWECFFHTIFYRQFYSLLLAKVGWVEARNPTINPKKPNKKIQTDLGVGCWVSLFLEN